MRLLLVEDERVLADGLADGLRREGFTVEVVYDGMSALSAAALTDFDVIILDRDLPVLGGDAVCTTLQDQHYPARILMLTAAGTVEDRVGGLNLGADDYLTKPFAYLELLARIRALGRRGAGAAPVVLEGGGLRLDTARRTVEQDGVPLRLTAKEFGIVEVLLLAGGAWVSVDELLDEVWDRPLEMTRTVVKSTMHTLRRKLVRQVIESATNFGYRIEAES
ncbi:MAG: response regulator transcription factor [Promicromonosporaceae bacterium]|nr:response regulator transcription factor [Promicromonosporaceae bacterium]